jgi:hypothetical protein
MREWAECLAAWVSPKKSLKHVDCAVHTMQHDRKVNEVGSNPEHIGGTS